MRWLNIVRTFTPSDTRVLSGPNIRIEKWFQNFINEFIDKVHFRGQTSKQFVEKNHENFMNNLPTVSVNIISCSQNLVNKILWKKFINFGFRYYYAPFSVRWGIRSDLWSQWLESCRISPTTSKSAIMRHRKILRFTYQCRGIICILHSHNILTDFFTMILYWYNLSWSK